MNWTEIFEYRDGHLYWKPRAENSFESKAIHRRWAGRYLGKKVGTDSSVRRARVRHVQVVFRGQKLYAHRIIWEMHHGAIPSGMQIDHIDGNGLNNRLENIRLVTAGGNRKNQPLRKDNKTGLFGVRWWAQRQKFEVYIDSGGKRIRLGVHKTLLDAACARKSAELALNFHKNHGRIDDIIASAKRAKELEQ